jgi:hypothetical protein
VQATPSPAPSEFALPFGYELTTYLDSDPVSQFDNPFNILSWWRDYKRT